MRVMLISIMSFVALSAVAGVKLDSSAAKDLFQDLKKDKVAVAGLYSCVEKPENESGYECDLNLKKDEFKEVQLTPNFSNIDISGNVAKELYKNLTSEEIWMGSITSMSGDAYGKGLGRDYSCTKTISSSLFGFSKKESYSCSFKIKK